LPSSRLTRSRSNGEGAIRAFGHHSLYPLGELFAKALVDTHGERSLRAIARAMSDVNDGPEVADDRFIFAVLEAAKIDLGVLGRFPRLEPKRTLTVDTLQVRALLGDLRRRRSV
jgi:hypothetical protein